MTIIEAIHSKKLFRSCFKELAKCLGMNYLALTNSLRLDLTSLYAMIPKKNRRRVKTIDSIDFTALTAADWAKRKGMGEEAIHHCRSYAMRAEIKMGEMLAEIEPKYSMSSINGTNRPHRDETLPAGITKKESHLAQTERARPAVGSKVIGDKRVPMKDKERPTLTELGLSRKEPSEAQMLAAIPKPFPALFKSSFHRCSLFHRDEGGGGGIISQGEAGIHLEVGALTGALFWFLNFIIFLYFLGIL